MKFFRKKDMDMTEGNIFHQLLMFSLPLLLGNLFQQLYNTVDTFVVGNYVSNDAFAAVGSVGPIINTLVGLFSGLATGAGVVVSQYYGAGDEKGVRRTVRTVYIMTFVMAIVLTAIGVFITPYSVRLMDTPPDVVGEAIEYLTIYFSGIAGLMFYNIGAGVLRSVGDSTRPFILIVVSAFINTVLDLLFVLVFNMGVAGVAWATVIAQFVSAIIVTILLMRTENCYRLTFERPAFDNGIFKKTVAIGLPAALQMAVTAFSNIFVQSYINHFDKDVMSGWTAYNKIDMFVMLPMMSMSLAATAFVGQNFGAGKIDRAKKGMKIALAMSVGMTVVLIIPVMLLARPLVAFFIPEESVIPYGIKILTLLSPLYVLCCVNQILSGALRGGGDARAPMVIMLGSFVVFRQIYLYLASVLAPDSLEITVLSYPAGWLLCSIIMYIYYRHSHWLDKRVKVVSHQP